MAPVLYLEPSEVDDGLDEDGVVTYVGVLGVQLGEWAEVRAAAGDVHTADGPLEGRGGDVGPEGIDDVLPAVLVQQHEGDLDTLGIFWILTSLKNKGNQKSSFNLCRV